MEKWLLEINSAEIEAIRDHHVDDRDIVDVKPLNEPGSTIIHWHIDECSPNTRRSASRERMLQQEAARPGN
jgi:hypothetical protein